MTFLVKALSLPGRERDLFRKLAAQPVRFEMSAIAWYEFARGPRTPEVLARARAQLADDGVITFSEELSERAADVFRRLGSPRKRAADIVIAVTAIHRGAQLLTANTRDYSGIEGLLQGEVT